METLDYNQLLLVSLWQYNHHGDEGLTPALFEETFGKEREAYTAIDRPENYRAKLANASFRTARPGPPGFGEKSSSPGGLAVFFPKALPFRKRLP